VFRVTAQTDQPPVAGTVAAATTAASGLSYYPTQSMTAIKTEFKSSNRDVGNAKVRVALRIAPSVAVHIVSRCSATRVPDYTTNATLFDGSVGVDTYTTLGPQDVVFEAPYTFASGDELTSQWVYYRYLAKDTDDTGSEVFEIEIEDVYRYGWVATSPGWQKYFMTFLTEPQRAALYVFAHEDNTSVKVTNLAGVVETVVINKWEMTTPGLLTEAVSVRATNPIQLGGNLHNEKLYIDVSIRDTKFIIPNHMYNNVHDEHIYVHQDNTTVSFSAMSDYQSGTTPLTITYPVKGLYMIRWGSSTSITGTTYDSYHTLRSGGTSGDKSTTNHGAHLIWSDKPISGISASQSGVQVVAWMSPSNTYSFTLRWKFIQFNGWWCFDDPGKYEGSSMAFNVVHTGTSTSSPSHALSVAKYQGVKNWSGTVSGQPYALQLQDSSISDVYFSVYTFADGAGRDSGMSIAPTYASTAYAQVLNVSGGDNDPGYVFSLDTGNQSVETITIDATTRLQTGVTSNDYVFTHNYNTFGVGVRSFTSNIPTNSNKVYRTTSPNTFFAPYVNTDSNKEGWKTGNMPYARDVLFTPLITPVPLVTVTGIETTMLTVGASWLIPRDSYRYTSIPDEFNGSLALKYAVSTNYPNVTITFNADVRVMAYLQDWSDHTAQDTVLSDKGFVSSSDTLAITATYTFVTRYRTYSAGSVETFDTLGTFGAGSAEFIYLAFAPA
jgi:hypothetical protein